MNDADLFGIDPTENRCDKPWAYSEYMLQKVSRTFAVNIAVLPPPLKRSITLGYLFCRMADTVEDEPTLPGGRKKELLKLFREIFAPGADWTDRADTFVAELPEGWSTSSEKDKFLTAHPHWPLRILFDLQAETVEHLAVTIRTMTEGMGEFASRQETPGAWQPLETEEELDRYCYYVAGTVGEMLTRLFESYSPLIGTREREVLRNNSIGFGQGLQLVNILKDAREDAERGISFIPEELCRKHGVTTATLFAPESVEPAAAVFRELIGKTLLSLDEAIDYTLSLPRLEPRIRLFCLWPLLMALATLEKATENRALLTGPKVKISRGEVKRIARTTTLQCGSNLLLRRRYETLRSRIASHLETY